MFKLTHKMYDEDVTEGFLEKRPIRGRGHSHSVYKRGLVKGLNVRKYSFKCRVTDQWNNLPEKVVMATNINTFKNRLDKLWYVSAVYFDHETDLLKSTSARSTRRAHLNASDDDTDLISEA